MSFQYELKFRIQHLAVLLAITVSPSITIIFWSSSQASFLTLSSINFWSYIFQSMTCFFRSSSRHAIQVRVSETTIFYLYSVMVSLMASSSFLFVFMQFLFGIFNFFASCNNDVLFIYYYFRNLRQVTKIFWPSFYTSKNSLSSLSSSLNMLHRCFSAPVYLHSSTYTWGW